MESPLESKKQLLDRNSLVNLARKWGRCKHRRYIVLRMPYFSDPRIEGVIGFRLEAGNTVVFGDPVCAATDQQELAKAFQPYCRSLKIGVVYLIVSEEFANREPVQALNRS